MSSEKVEVELALATVTALSLAAKSTAEEMHLIVDPEEESSMGMTPLLAPSGAVSNAEATETYEPLNSRKDSVAYSSSSSDGGAVSRRSRIPVALLQNAHPLQKDDARTEENGTEVSSATADHENENDINNDNRKRTPKDFKYGEQLGEGSYSTVLLAVEMATNKTFAIKILDKRHIVKEKKAKYVNIERDVLTMARHPFIVRLHYTFQDTESLFFVLDYAKHGDLLSHIRRLGALDESCARFYLAEIITAVEHLHSLGVIHRDLKPENVLIGDNMHIMLTDFGSAKILDPSDASGRANSFVGTADYVSPELLISKYTTKCADLWAIGCILYQMLAGRTPFKAANDYLIFQRITKFDLQFPEGFPTVARDLVSKLLQVDPLKRLGADTNDNSNGNGYAALKAHPFFRGIVWDTLSQQTPPAMRATDVAAVSQPSVEQKRDQSVPVAIQTLGPMSSSERAERLKLQSFSKWSAFLLDDELIVHQGTVMKRKGLFAKKRHLILTDRPRLIYIDAERLQQMGEIPWSVQLQPEFKNNRHFFVHTPNRTYYLEDVNGDAETWVEAIRAAMQRYKSNNVNA